VSCSAAARAYHDAVHCQPNLSLVVTTPGRSFLHGPVDAVEELSLVILRVVSIDPS
jgi:hypothetical protein